LEQQANYDVFLSYATPDRLVVKELAQKLGLQGLSVWLDEWKLIGGEPWQEAIEKALESCNAVAICIGPGEPGRWQTMEMRVAITQQAEEKGLRVIPVLLPRPQRGGLSRLPAFLREYKGIEFGETLEDEETLRHLGCAIRGVEPGPGPGEAIAENRCPYRGLQAFGVDDAIFFCGRDALTKRLVDRLRTSRSGPRFLAIVGSSGSGKSSLARAGLLAALKRGDIPGSEAWPVADCKPGKQPLRNLAIAFTTAFRPRDKPRDEALEETLVSERIQRLGKEPDALYTATRLALDGSPPDRRLIVLVDQFEEAFSCPEETQCRALIDNLLCAAMEPDGQTLVVLTLRADFYERCADYKDLAKVLTSDRQSLISPMGPEELRNAIKNPAYHAGCELDAGLTDLLLRDVQAQAGSLPLLEDALLQIWQHREGRRRLTIKAYDEIGGVAGALEKHAEKVYSGFTDETEREICRRVFLRLIQVDEQGRVTKRRLEFAELTPAARADSQALKTVIDRLADGDSRLLTTDQQEKELSPTVELTHEALITHWGRLKKWVEDDLNDLKIHRRLEDEAARWSGGQRDPSFLYRGIPLAQAEKWAQSHPDELSQKEDEFLKESIAQRNEEVRREKQRRQLNMILLTAATLTAVIVAGVMYGLWSRSARQQQINLATQMAGQAKLVLASNPLTGLLLGTKAVQLKDNLPEARGACSEPWLVPTRRLWGNPGSSPSRQLRIGARS
jgi:energy-coupling factor transporter ATP-binding protein EcfA2